MSGLYDLYLAQGAVPDSELRGPEHPVEQGASSGQRTAPVAQGGKSLASIDRAKIFAARKAHQSSLVRSRAAVEGEDERIETCPTCGAAVNRDGAAPTTHQREVDEDLYREPAGASKQSVAAFAADYWAKRKGR